MTLTHRLMLALSLAALGGCQEQPCPPEQAVCGPAERGPMTLTHGRLVLTAGAAMDDTHDARGALTTGHVVSHADGLRLIATLTD